jgi:hypothetical protein
MVKILAAARYIIGICLLISLGFSLAGCGGSSSGTSGLSGTPTPPPSAHSVNLSWLPSSSPNIAAYNVYRTTTASGGFTKLGSTKVTTFVDGNVQSGQTYLYEVTAVDSANAESGPSGQASAAVP